MSSEDEFDYVIVGAGAAGCVLASRLTEDESSTVVQLEAGPDNKHLYLRIPAGFTKIVGSPRFAWRFHTEPTESLGGRTIGLTQGRVVGGGTSIPLMEVPPPTTRPCVRPIVLPPRDSVGSVDRKSVV